VLVDHGREQRGYSVARRGRTRHGGAVLIRREGPADAEVIRAITAAAFARRGTPGHAPPEVRLVDELRGSEAWIPALSLVAVEPDGGVTGHVLCTRGHVGDAPVLALGPVAVRPDRQRAGVGSALMHAVLGAGDALGEPLVALLGDPGYYRRFGFRLSRDYAIAPPVASWRPHFQVRLLAAYQPSVRGTFRYAEPFDRV
jgi:putative acetyltransferase